MYAKVSCGVESAQWAGAISLWYDGFDERTRLPKTTLQTQQCFPPWQGDKYRQWSLRGQPARNAHDQRIQCACMTDLLWLYSYLGQDPVMHELHVISSSAQALTCMLSTRCQQGMTIFACSNRRSVHPFLHSAKECVPLFYKRFNVHYKPTRLLVCYSKSLCDIVSRSAVQKVWTE